MAERISKRELDPKATTNMYSQGHVELILFFPQQIQFVFWAVSFDTIKNKNRILKLIKGTVHLQS